MVEVNGFDLDEEALVRSLYRRFLAEGYEMHELDRIEKREMAGYNGLVEPHLPHGASRLRSTLYLALPVPFTIVHELAHVADIAVRQQETKDHISASMPDTWHLAHRLSSEYYANRIATGFCSDEEIFPAFQNDRIGMIAAAIKDEWANFLINYSMLLGIFHGLGRLDIEPLELLPDAHTDRLPDPVIRGMSAFRNQADDFFRSYGKEPVLA
ncbi:MAG: hypothetical protein H7Z12_18370 [Rhodospirillaceae bacterium]|nr:hypothetical protein [Rhodospirillales bacterium]